ncbi:glycosyltransferase family A protein [Anaerospora sp.]|uniref:glycosyltransferase family A protein n=1 Tax=Anaerospora sp. TaxID=1960278 RepID=UPI00289F3226|nr:glycosyltransferase family A protein [Anaerospora sp.]
MYISVIIPTRNRASELNIALESIEQQNLPQDEFEVLVVDNGSIDNTGDVVKSFRDKIINLRYFFEPTPGLHVGRHCGLKNANTDILVFADDDIRAFPTWLTAIKSIFEQNPEVVLVGGKNLPDYEIEPPTWVLNLWSQCKYGKCLGYYSILDFGDDIKEISPYYVWGCNFSIRRKVLLGVGGFHPDGMPKELLEYRGDGETAVSAAIAANHWKTIYHPAASVYHLVSKQRMTVAYLYNRAYAQGISDSYTKIRADNGLLEAARSRSTSNREMDLVKRTLRNGYEDGYAFHQLKVRSNPDILSWVLRKDYFDV